MFDRITVGLTSCFNPLASNVQYINIVRIILYVLTKHTRKFGSIYKAFRMYFYDQDEENLIL